MINDDGHVSGGQASRGHDTDGHGVGSHENCGVDDYRMFQTYSKQNCRS